MISSPYLVIHAMSFTYQDQKVVLFNDMRRTQVQDQNDCFAFSRTIMPFVKVFFTHFVLRKYKTP